MGPLIRGGCVGAPGSATDLPWFPILLYHRVVPVLPQYDPYGTCITPGAFERHVKWFADHGYHSRSLPEMARMMDQAAGSRCPIPRRSVAITFDDGYLDNYRHAWPILQRFGFTATIFLVSDAIGRDSSFDAASGYQLVPMLGSREIREMYRAGIAFGSHSCSHPASLVDLPDVVLADELGRSRAVIEDVVDAPVESFAYPHNEVDGRVEAAVARAGYRLACAGPGLTLAPYRLHRMDPRHLRGSFELAINRRHLRWWVRKQLETGALGRLLPGARQFLKSRERKRQQGPS